jgi:hemoglobin
MSDETTTSQTLYERLGGQAGIATLIDRFYDKVVADPEIGPFFAGAPVDRIRTMQKEFFAAALDGPQSYSGLALSRSHADLGIKAGHFSRYVNILLETLREIGIKPRDIDAVIARVSTYADDILSPGAFAG